MWRMICRLKTHTHNRTKCVGGVINQSCVIFLVNGPCGMPLCVYDSTSAIGNLIKRRLLNAVR